MDKVLEVYRKQNLNYSGKRIKCVKMNDPNPVESGTEGVVKGVDDMGTIHVNWDNGRTLGIVPSEDQFELL